MNIEILYFIKKYIYIEIPEKMIIKFSSNIIHYN